MKSRSRGVHTEAGKETHATVFVFDTVGKVFEKILLARVLREVSERGLIRDQQLGFRPRLSTTLQLARLFERVNRNFDERRLTSEVFLDVVKPSIPYESKASFTS
jgi:hypothetical protein